MSVPAESPAPRTPSEPCEQSNPITAPETERVSHLAQVAPSHLSEPHEQINPIIPPETERVGRLGPVAPSLLQVMLSPATVEERNQRNILIDGLGVGLFSGIATFLSVFMVRLGASSLAIGLLTAMPALTGILLAIPVGEMLSRRRHVIPWYARSRLMVVCCYALTGVVPFLISTHRPEAIILIFAVATLPQTVLSVAFTVVMGRVAGEGGRYTLMSRRWALMGLSTALAILAVGQALKGAEFPLNYQLVFMASAAGGVICYVFSSRVRLPPVESAAEKKPLLGMLRSHGRSLATNKRFVKFIAGQFVLRLGISMCLPLLPIFWVRNIGASDSGIAAINSTQTLAMMAAYFVWARLSQRRGQRWVLLASTLGFSFYPLLTALSVSTVWLVVWAGMAGVFGAGVDLVVFDVLLSTCPSEDQPTYIGIYQTTVNIAVFLAPMAGTLLADTVGIAPALIVSSILRFAGFGLLAVLGVGAGREPSARIGP